MVREWFHLTSARNYINLMASWTASFNPASEWLKSSMSVSSLSSFGIKNILFVWHPLEPFDLNSTYWTKQRDNVSIKCTSLRAACIRRLTCPKENQIEIILLSLCFENLKFYAWVKRLVSKSRCLMVGCANPKYGRSFQNPSNQLKGKYSYFQVQFSSNLALERARPSAAVQHNGKDEPINSWIWFLIIIY